MENRDFNAGLIIIILSAFALGFIVAAAIYDNRPITEENYRELQNIQYYMN
jgi:hypothetical protein